MARTQPAKAPIAAAATSTTMPALHRGQPWFVTRTPSNEEESAAIEPTEMSISPATMTKVIANATIPKKAACCKMLSWLSSVRKVGEATDRTT